MVNFTPVLVSLLILLTSPAQLLAASAGTETIEVSVLYRERIMLPPGSFVTVTLSDVTKMDVPATEISSASHEITTGPPYRLTLFYDPETIVDNHRYSLKARIENNEKLLFISTEAIDPFTISGRPIEIMTQKVAVSPAEPSTATLLNTRWRLLAAHNIEIEVKEGGEVPFLQLVEDQKMVQGFGGCNNFRGAYRLAGSSLEFSQVAATMKMCQDGMEQEQLFFSVLNSAASHKISGRQLHLFDAEKELIGIFTPLNKAN